MKGRNMKITLIGLLFLFLPLVLIPISNAATSIWGVSEGDVKTYTFITTRTGSIEDSSDYGEFTFTIVTIWDQDANNYLELLHGYERIVLGYPTMTLVVLQDEDFNWNYNDLIGPVTTGITDVYPIVPTRYNGSDGMGMNWTEEINTINSLTNYTTSIEGNILNIHHWTTGTDGGSGAFYTEDEYIEWDMSTGWLETYTLIRDYGDPANYEETTTVQGKGGAAIDITLIIGIIAVACGIAAIGLAYLAWRKSKRQ